MTPEEFVPTGGPIEPSAAARKASKLLRGLYLALLDEGFDAQQALFLTAEAMQMWGHTCQS